MVEVSDTSYEIIMLLVNGLTTVIYVFQICYDSSIATPHRNVSFIYVVIQHNGLPKEISLKRSEILIQF